MKKLIVSAIAFSLSFLAFAQTTSEEMMANLNKTGGVYYAYPATKADNTPAPKGYKPFHISHFGRHGSRYLISDDDYDRVADLLHRANSADALTPLGKELMERVDSLLVETRGRGGDLSPLGRRQHHDIAARMHNNYPEVFTDNASITARSTLVPRCILSMAYFCESLKEKNHDLYIDMESSNRHMPYICHSVKESDDFNNGWWEEVYRKFKERQTHPERMVSSIFSDSEFIDRYVRQDDFIWDIYWLASDAQNTEGKIDFYKFFTAQEAFDLWQVFNSVFYAKHADYAPAKGVHLQNAANLLNNIIDTADAAISSDTPSVALRFGHDGNVVPLTTLMSLERCDATMERPEDFYKGWCDWYVTPMGANIQMVFFRNPKKPGKILVKILHNEKETRIPVETDMWPYYDWQDVKAFFKSRIK